MDSELEDTARQYRGLAGIAKTSPEGRKNTAAPKSDADEADEQKAALPQPDSKSRSRR